MDSTCPKCSNPDSHVDFLGNRQCRYCSTLWGSWGIDEGEPFDDEPTMSSDFDEFAQRAEGDRNG